MREKGTLIVVSGPSGVGKGTLCNIILNRLENLSLSISATTRAPRVGEVDGVNYFFMKKQVFEEKINQNKFLEWAKVYTNYYGTPTDYVKQKLEEGKDVILEIDIQGAAKVRKRCPEGIFIFILPPSLEELRDRIVKRGSDTPEAIKLRMKSAKEELKAAYSYDYVVVNDNLDKASKSLEAIILAERCKTLRNHNLLQKLEGGKQL